MRIVITYSPGEFQAAFVLRDCIGVLSPGAEIELKSTNPLLLPTISMEGISRLVKYSDDISDKVRQGLGIQSKKAAPKNKPWPKALRIPENGPGGAACPAP